jgi:hypothetical protein
MELSQFRGTSSHSANQEITSISWNPTLHYRIHNIPQLDHVLSHKNAVHTIIYYFFTIHFNVILPPSLGIPASLFPLFSLT